VTRFIARRLALVVPVLFLVSILVFALVYLSPGDPVTAIVGPDVVDPQVMAAVRADLNLDQPPVVQYLLWFGRLARGDLGYSFHRRESVGQLVSERLPVTIELALLSVMLSLAVAFPLGILAATHRGSWLDLLSSTGSALGASMPAFWLAVLLVLLFSVQLRVLPAFGFVTLTSDPVGNIKSLLLPAATLAAGYAAILARLVRASLLDVLEEDYVRTARSKGLSNRSVIVGHALRSALLPVITTIGLESGRLLGGAVVTETIFALPGIGRLAVDAVTSHDLPTLQGVALFMAAALLLSNLAADLLYGVADPRIRHG
jgi:peptide/nickel transport system permease protein